MLSKELAQGPLVRISGGQPADRPPQRGGVASSPDWPRNCAHWLCIVHSCATSGQQQDLACPTCLHTPQRYQTESFRLSNVAGAREGERNQLCFWGACRLREMVDQQLIPQDDAIAIVVEAASRAGLPHAEALRTARSALRNARTDVRRQSGGVR